MGTYSTQEFIDTFGGLPEPGEAYPDLDALREQAKERSTCSGCLARTYRDEECVCEDGGDAEDCS